MIDKGYVKVRGRLTEEELVIATTVALTSFLSFVALIMVWRINRASSRYYKEQVDELFEYISQRDPS